MLLSNLVAKYEHYASDLEDENNPMLFQVIWNDAKAASLTEVTF
jgi:hypothetical protein